jgi:hypothetical protein
MAKKGNFYIVRLRENDDLVVCGSSKECAAEMGMTMSTFYTTVSRSRTGQVKKWDIDVFKEGLDANN